MSVDDTVNSIVNNLADRIGTVTPKIEGVAVTVIEETRRLAAVQCMIGFGVVLCLVLASASLFVAARRHAKHKGGDDVAAGCVAAGAVVAFAALLLTYAVCSEALPNYLAPTRSVIESLLVRK